MLNPAPTCNRWPRPRLTQLSGLLSAQTTVVRGFTMVELMIAVIIVGVLAALAYPTFIDSIRKARRAEAYTALAAVQQAQERWRSSNPSYTTVLGPPPAPGVTPAGLRLPARTPSAYYDISISSADAVGYVALATAVSGSSQANDSACTRMAVRITAGGNIGHGSGSGDSIDWSDPGRCFAK